MDVINSKFIKLNAQLSDKESVIECIVNILTKEERCNNQKLLFSDIYMREKETSTSMGLGVAIPHAKSSSINNATVVFLRLKDQIKWDLDSNIELVFGIFVPSENENNQHLKILSNLARQLANESFREKLLQAPTEEDCLNLLSTIEAN